MTSPDLTARNIEKIAELFPNVVTETLDEHGEPKAAIDFDLLRQELSDHVVEGPTERYHLNWPGKRQAAFAANAPIAKTLRPVREESVNFDETKNLFIEGDNLEVLKLLQESYLGKIKLIYIDPPYNTGHDFLYQDDFALTARDYLQLSGQTNGTGARLISNPEAGGRFHSDWLSMMYPRLKLARNLLTEDGIIFVSIDDNEYSNLRRILDEIFGKDNFFCEIVVKRSEGGGMAKRVVKGHDYLLAYTREDRKFPGIYRKKDIRGEITELNGEEYWIEVDWLRPSFGPYAILYYEDIESIKGVDFKREIDNGISEGKYVLIPKDENHIVGRLRKISTDGSKFYSIINHLNKNAKFDFEKIGLELLFDKPKPLSLVKEIIMGATRFSPKDENIILDFFAGSATSAHAVLESNAEDGGNRSFIMVQLDETPDPKSKAAKLGYKTIADISRDRIRHASKQITNNTAIDSENFDSGFRSFKLDTTNRESVSLSVDSIDQLSLSQLESNFKSDRSNEDLLFQIMLEWGLELSLPIKVETIGSKLVHVVEDGALAACFDQEVTDDVIAFIADLRPARAVFREDGFLSDDARINVEQKFKQVERESGVAIDVKVI